MTRHLIKTNAGTFETIRDGYQTSIIVKNDRLWNPGDELWFAECGQDSRQLTGKVIRVIVNSLNSERLGFNRHVKRCIFFRSQANLQPSVWRILHNRKLRASLRRVALPFSTRRSRPTPQSWRVC